MCAPAGARMRAPGPGRMRPGLPIFDSRFQMLRTLLQSADQDPKFAQLADEGGSAFVSQSLRPYLLAALLDRNESAPAIVVAGDDRAARDLAAALKAWLAPRQVRYYPSRGVTYESHLTPPPHLVGLRIAALDS